MRFGGQYGLMLVLAIVPASAQAGDKAAPVQVSGNIAGFFDPSGYPVDAMRAREQGRVVASVAIDAEGKATKCAIATSSNSVSLDATTCSIAMTKIHFVAARDAAGRNVPGTYDLKVRWVLPPAPPGTTLVTFGGTAADPTCSVVVAGATRHLAAQGCRSLANAITNRGGNLSQPVFVALPDQPGFLLPERQ
jgi:TonB family protein